MSILKNIAQRVLKDDIAALQESVTKLAEATSTNEAGWINVSQGFVPWEITGEERQRVIEKVREAYKKNPMAGQIVDIKKHFTIGQGISFKAEAPEVNEVLKAFWEDGSNKWFLRQSQLSDDLEIDGEFFIRFFTDKYTGRMQVRCIPAWQITDIVTDQEDAETPLYYRREWVEQAWDPVSKLYVIVKYHTGVDADYIPAEEILHVKVGAPLYAKFGNSPLYRVLGYLNSYKEWLEDRAKINKARAAFAWKKKIKSTASGVASAVSGVLNTLNKVVTGVEKPTPPKTGGVIVENDAVEWSIVNSDVKADSAAEDGRAIKLMIVAGSGIFEHWFGDSKISTRAGADSMEIPMLKMFEWRQKLFEQGLFIPMFRRVIQTAVDAGVLSEKIKVSRQTGGETVELEIETVDVSIDMDFPPLVAKQIKDLTDALVKQVQEGWKSKQTAAMEVGVEDWQQELSLIQQEQEEQAAKQRENDTNLFPPFDPPKGGRKDGKGNHKPGNQQAGEDDGGGEE